MSLLQIVFSFLAALVLALHPAYTDSSLAAELEYGHQYLVQRRVISPGVISCKIENRMSPSDILDRGDPAIFRAMIAEALEVNGSHCLDKELGVTMDDLDSEITFSLDTGKIALSPNGIKVQTSVYGILRPVTYKLDVRGPIAN